MTRPRAASAACLLGCGAALLLAACSASSPAALASPSTTSAAAAASSAGATAALRAAARAMATASGYRFTATVTVGPTQTGVVGEFQAPDRVHETITVPRASLVEAVFAGSQVFVRQNGGPWAHSATPSLHPEADPRAAFGALGQATDVRPVDGWYRFTLPAAAVNGLLEGGGGASARGTGRAHITGAGIDRLELRLSSRGRNITMLLGYTDIGSAPPVATPA